MSSSDDCSLNDEDLANVSLGSDSDDSSVEITQTFLIGKIDYKAQKATQVSFKKGARILQLGEPDKGWFRGRLDSSLEEGLFPAAYCVTEDEWAALKAAAAAEEEVLMVCKCLVDHVSKDAKFLSFKASDRVEVLDTSDKTRWKARFRGKIGFVDPKMLEEDQGFTLRKAAAKKQASRDQFANRRVKESSSITEKSKSDSQRDLGHLRKEQEKLQQERDNIKQEKEKRKQMRERRQSGSFKDRVNSKKQEAEAKAKAQKQAEEQAKQAAN